MFDIVAVVILGCKLVLDWGNKRGERRDLYFQVGVNLKISLHII